MKIEDQVCSIEHAKKLKELGVKQESLWHWIERDSQDIYMFPFELLPLRDGIEYESYAAFAVAELSEMLPFYLEITEGGIPYDCPLLFQKRSYGYTCNFHRVEIKEDTLPDVYARTLIYLIEHNLITLL